ncbi:protein phosphatase 2C domain-containing protein [Nocardia farcinica]|uniref:protein phosphatase 2C domain-containing protein n=1 Tax=Nocardia farcinica TaxID=37329 RepID=UPI001894BCA5|nr:protein phosphatase 2C domain-containing protein [Nocardia farcinica]MBF6385265.1 protein phosphatase 2C domain-containing protein [Nocardia farcinica]
MDGPIGAVSPHRCPVRIAIAQLPARTNEDRALPIENALVVMDGATSHHPGIPPASEYVDALGAALAQHLIPDAELPPALADAIRDTARELGLAPGRSPSSTVAIVRIAVDTVSVLLLGDTTVIVRRTDGSHEIHTDDRLGALGIPQAAEYRRRLAHGSGYDDVHRRLLRELQERQREQRNRPGGYWIAEADPSAAAHAIRLDIPRNSVSWLVAATDGAREPIQSLGIPWTDIAQQSADELGALLRTCHSWEAETDPDGRILPRSKRHDDKTLAVVRL